MFAPGALPSQSGQFADHWSTGVNPGTGGSEAGFNFYTANLERKYFSVYFKSKVGVSFTEWVRLLRISRAKELMAAREASIAGRITSRAIRALSSRFSGSAIPIKNWSDATGPPDSPMFRR